MKKAVIFILVKDNQVLMEQRTFSQMYANILVYPGGHIEEDETIEQAFLREAQEELGIVPTDYQLLENATYTSKNDVFVTTFMVKDWEGKIPNTVLDQGNPLVWVNLSQLKESELEQVRVIADKLSDYLSEACELESKFLGDITS